MLEHKTMFTRSPPSGSLEIVTRCDIDVTGCCVYKMPCDSASTTKSVRPSQVCHAQVGFLYRCSLVSAGSHPDSQLKYSRAKLSKFTLDAGRHLSVLVIYAGYQID